MSAAQYNITIEKDSDFVRTFVVKQDGTPLNLTDHSFAAQVREHLTSTTATDFTTAVTDAANGGFTISLTDTQTSAMETATQYYDIVMTKPDGKKQRLMEGKAFVTGGVTR